MKTPLEDHEFDMFTKALDRRADELGPALEARLDRARRHAVEKGLTRRSLSLLPMGRLVLAGAGAALVALLTISAHRGPSSGPPMAKGVEEFEILTAQEQLDVMEDPEFFRWLMEREAAEFRREG
jgi:hypothetical protein